MTEEMEPIVKALVDQYMSVWKMLQDAIDEYVPDGVTVNPMVVHGEADRQILEAAEQMGTDLIVIATHGASGWQHMMCGSVLEKIVRRAKGNVLTVYSEVGKK